MFAKLIALAGVCCILSAQAQMEPLRFKDIEAAKQWFSTIYPSHKFEKTIVKTSASQEIEVFAFYGPRGSGVITMDGWYYSCLKASSCDLVAMMDLGEAKRQKAAPRIFYDSPNLVIDSDGRRTLKIRVLEKQQR